MILACVRLLAARSVILARIRQWTLQIKEALRAVLVPDTTFAVSKLQATPRDPSLSAGGLPRRDKFRYIGPSGQ